MSPRVRWALASAAAVGLALLLALVFFSTHHKVTETKVLPPTGEASYNPLYVLGQALRADGLTVHSRPRLDWAAMSPGPHDTVVVLQDSAELTPSQVRQALAWVERGGHLLVRTPPPDGDATAVEPRLLQALGIDSRGNEKKCQPFHVADDPGHVEFCQGRRFEIEARVDTKVQRAWRSEAGYVFARLRRGQGLVDVLADMDFMKGVPDSSASPDVLDVRPPYDPAAPRDGLYDRAHRDLTRYLLAPNYGKGTMWLVYSSRSPSLWSRIVHEGWPLWLPLLLALLAWLWARAQRFGSLLPPPPAERRSLLEHVRASGELLLRHQQGPRLHAAVRDLFLRRLHRRAPSAAVLDGAAREQAIAELLRWPREHVQTALTPPVPNDTAALKARITLLLQMRSLL